MNRKPLISGIETLHSSLRQASPLSVRFGFEVQGVDLVITAYWVACEFRRNVPRVNAARKLATVRFPSRRPTWLDRVVIVPEEAQRAARELLVQCNARLMANRKPGWCDTGHFIVGVEANDPIAEYIEHEPTSASYRIVSLPLVDAAMWSDDFVVETVAWISRNPAPSDVTGAALRLYRRRFRDRIRMMAP